MILAGDVGGTKCNLGLFVQEGLVLRSVFQRRLATRDYAGFEDLVEGQSMSESLDESTGIAKRVVTDWRTGGSGRGQSDSLGDLLFIFSVGGVQLAVDDPATLRISLCDQMIKIEGETPLERAHRVNVVDGF